MNELKGRDGAPFQLHISDNDALDFDTYSKSLFEDPFEFQKSTVPPSPAQLGRSFSTGNDVRSPKREERRVRQFVPSPLASDLRRSNDDLRGKMGTPKSRRGPRSVRSPFPFNASPDVSQRKDREKVPLWLQGDEKGERLRSNGNSRSFNKNNSMNSSSGADGLVNENNGNKRNPNSARSSSGMLRYR